MYKRGDKGGTPLPTFFLRKNVLDNVPPNMGNLKDLKYQTPFSSSYDINSWPNMLSARPMCDTRPVTLTQEIIKDRCKHILSHINIDAFFYHLTDDPLFEENTKWKTYLYLRKCVLDYRARLPHEELSLVLAFLCSNSKNKRWLEARLMDKASKELDEYWGSGMHEWVERCLLTQVLERSAGMVEEVEETKDMGCIWGDIDWLYLQAVCRSATKYLFYKKPDNSIVSGHCGAIKRDLNKTGFAKEGEKAFDKKVILAFNQSTRLVQLIKRIINLFKEEITNAKRFIPASDYKRFLVTGITTNDENALEEFRQEKLIPFRVEMLEEMFKPLYICISKHGDDDDNTIEIVDSSSDEVDDLGYTVNELKF